MGLSWSLDADSRYNVSEVEDLNQGRLNVTLHIAFVDWEDAGNYTCLASRSTALSDNASKTIEVIVRGGLEAAVTIAPSYARYYVLSGAQLQLNCSNSGQTGELRWYKGDINLNSDNDTRLTISNEMSGGMIHSILTYTSADTTMSGNYTCQLEGSGLSQQSEITVEVISITTTDAQFQNGTDAFLRCQTPELKVLIVWMKDKTPVKNLKPTENTTYVEHSDGTLEIQNPTLDSIAVYTCTVQIQDATSQSLEVPVMLYTQLEVLALENSTTVLLRDSVEITCMVEGKPSPSVTWLKNGTELELGADSRYNVSEVEDSNQGRLNVTLHIAVADWEDAGNYTCLASRSTALSDNASMTIEVIVRDTMDDEFCFKKDVLLRCRADDPNSNVTWLKNGTNVSELNSLSKTQFVEHNNGDLKIIRPKRDIAGVYVCRYSDKNKMEVEKNVTLFAEPYVLPFQANVSLTEQGRVELLCRVLGYPRPISITWFKDGVEINMTEERELNESHYNFSEAEGYSNARLVIESVVIEDDGNYTCWASNGSITRGNWVLIRVRGKLAPLWPLLGILVQVILLAVIISVSEKRRKRKEKAEDRSTASSVRVKQDTSSSLRHRGRQSKVDPQETSDAVTKL
ncbi:hemicentin-1-like isoform X2 [Pomacea canaliculata]|uniref:hemicentin-1-like isoform X2 n=1 Tax=Pomacea canaliculata TaxID=400727 RepID=UPI000D725A49|nr:hemicentin-1-like isoform X2 [Pomacea canaliculata]